MDQEHKEVAAERYAMLVSHVIKHHRVDVRLIESVRPNVDNIDFHLLEAHCYNCEWWDHWDEKKEDWT